MPHTQHKEPEMAQSRKTNKANEAKARTQRIVFIAIAVVVLLAGGFAVVSGGDSPTSGGTGSVPNGAGEFQDAEIIGDALPAQPESGTDPAIGMKVPEIRARNFDGGPVSLRIASVKRPTMVVFLAHWCPHCNREVPRILELDAQGGIPAELRVVGVATGSRDDQPNWPPSVWLEEMKWKWEVAADSQDGRIFAAYGGMSFPTMVLVAPDGSVMDRFSGEAEVSELEARITAFLQKVSPV